MASSCSVCGHRFDHEHDYEGSHWKLIVKEGHVGVPDGEHQEQKRKRHMDEEPAMEPVMEAGLEIEHAPFVAPGLDFFDSTAVVFGHT